MGRVRSCCVVLDRVGSSLVGSGHVALCRVSSCRVGWCQVVWGRVMSGRVGPCCGALGCVGSSRFA